MAKQDLPSTFASLVIARAAQMAIENVQPLAACVEEAYGLEYADWSKNDDVFGCRAISPADEETIHAHLAILGFTI